MKCYLKDHDLYKDADEVITRMERKHMDLRTYHWNRSFDLAYGYGYPVKQPISLLVMRDVMLERQKYGVAKHIDSLVKSRCDFGDRIIYFITNVFYLLYKTYIFYA